MIQDKPRDQGLFFAASDDEDDNNSTTAQSVRPPSPSSSSPHSLHQKRLFFADSDDDDIPRFQTPNIALTNASLAINGDDDSGSDLEMPSFEEVPRASSVSSLSSGVSLRTSSPVPGPSGEEPPVKKRRLSPPKVQAHTEQLETPFRTAYLGSFIVGNAWSTVRGKGYIKQGDTIRIERDDLLDPSSSLSVQAKGKKTKQLTLGAMLKSQPLKTTKKTDTVVRLTNDRGFEFGRLPQHVSSWVSKLLDLGIVDFKGSTVVDCPATLHSGADLIVSLSVYLRISAFKPPSTSAVDPSKNILNQGQETQDERTLRERKTALLSLFEAVNLRPRRGARDQDDGNKENESDDIVNQLTQYHGAAKQKKTEVVGDGEEIEVDEGEELSDNELDMIYKKAQKNDLSMAEMDPPDTFTLTLRGYQKQALMWMHSKELGKNSAREAVSMHPLWSEYIFPPAPRDGIIDLTEDEEAFYFNPYSGELSLDFPKAERKFKGGILADGKVHSLSDIILLITNIFQSGTPRRECVLGMGKTIMLSALIHTNQDPEPIRPDDTSRDLARARQLKLDNAFRSIASGQRKKATKGPSATLIVAPTSLLFQWYDELQRSSVPGTLQATVWHGQNRLDLDGIEDDSNDDAHITVIITSYGVLASEHSKLLKSGGQPSIFQVEWLRVILDEAHHCKSRTSRTARAVYALRARRKWAVTGTPIVNKLEDLHSLLQFLEYTPWSSYSFFRSFITVPFLARDPKAIEIVQVILESILLRREKNMRDNSGKRIIELPAKEVTVDTLQFTPAEQKIYNAIYSAAKRDFDQLNAKGLVGKNYTHILAMLMRLRRAVLHPDLVADASDETETKPPGHSKDGAIDVDALMTDISEHDLSNGSKLAYAESVIANLDTSHDAECPICLDVMQVPAIIPSCMHQCCKECIISYLASCTDKGEEPRCPTCSQGPVKEQDLIEVLRPRPGQGGRQQESTEGEREDTSTSEVFLRRNDFRSSTKLDALVQNLRRLRDQDPYFRAVVFSQFTSFLSLISVALDREHLSWYRFDGSMDVKKRNAAISEFKQNERKPKVLIVSLKAGGVGLNLTTANHVFMMDCWWNAATENQAIDRVHRIGQEKTVYVKHFIIDHTIEGRILQIQKRKTAIVKEAFRGSDKLGKTDPESLENLKVIFGDD